MNLLTLYLRSSTNVIFFLLHAEPVSCLDDKKKKLIKLRNFVDRPFLFLQFSSDIEPHHHTRLF